MERQIKPRGSKLQQLARSIWIRLPSGFRFWLMQRTQSAFLVAVVGIVQDGEGRILCLHHVFRPKHSPWGLPSGFLSLGESPAEGLRRELLEEAGCSIAEPVVLEIRNLRRNQLEILMQAKLTKIEPQSSFECTDLGWFFPHELPAGFLRSNVELLRRHGFLQR